MKHIILTLTVAVVACGLLTGCNNEKYRVDRVLSTDKDLGLPWTESSEAAFQTVIEKLNPYTYAGVKLDKDSLEHSFYNIASGRGNPTPSDIERKSARNQLQAAIMRISDESTAVHLTAVKAAENNINVMLGLPAIGMSAAAAITTAGASHVLSAGSAALQGSRAYVNEQVFRNTLFDSIILLIEEDRNSAKAAIRLNWDKSIAEYNVETAMQDAQDYHDRGSFYHGLALLANAANEKASRMRGSRTGLESPGVLPSFLAKSAVDNAELKVMAASTTLAGLNAQKVLLGEQLKTAQSKLDQAAEGEEKIRATNARDDIAKAITDKDTEIAAATQTLTKATTDLAAARAEYDKRFTVAPGSGL